MANPSPSAGSLAAALQAQGPYTDFAAVPDGDLVRVRLELLDDNPYQPRAHIDATLLAELATSIAAQGLIQPIAVRPKSDGRYVIVAGHRRVAAFRQLLEKAKNDEERSTYGAIPGVIKAALDDTRLAAMAFVENKEREGLTLVEEGRALNRMIEAGLAASNEELSTLTGQPLRSISRLRRLVKAPKFLLGAVESGVMVVVGVDDEGKEKKELRKLDLMAALAFLTLHESLQKGPKPSTADDRTEAAMRRALASNWSFRRIEDYVQDAKDGGRSDGESDAAELSAAPHEAAVFTQTPKRFVVDLLRLQTASPSQRAALKAAFGELLAGAHQG